MVNTVKVELNVPKESKEVLDFLAKIVAEMKAKKPMAEIATGSLAELYEAVKGFDMLDDEAKSEHKADLIGYAGREIVKSLGV